MDQGIVVVGFLFVVFFIIGLIVAVAEKYLDKKLKNRGQK
jgi:preprotein translocase subunit SecG